MTDPLAAIKQRRAYAPNMLLEEDANWLVAEVERLRGEMVEQSRMLRIAYGDPALIADGALAEVAYLRGLLGRLEWAGQPVPGTRIGTQPRCPVCRVSQLPHDRGCWLAAAIHPTSDPPEGERP